MLWTVDPFSILFSLGKVTFDMTIGAYNFEIFWLVVVVVAVDVMNLEKVKLTYSTFAHRVPKELLEMICSALELGSVIASEIVALSRAVMMSFVSNVVGTMDKEIGGTDSAFDGNFQFRVVAPHRAISSVRCPSVTQVRLAAGFAYGLNFCSMFSAHLIQNTNVSFVRR